MSLINPTVGNEGQFTAPFDILPNIIYTNPSSLGGSQFTAPFDILPNPSLLSYNITNGNEFQFGINPPIVLGGMPTFDLLPNPPKNSLDNPMDPTSNAFKKATNYNSVKPGFKSILNTDTEKLNDAQSATLWTTPAVMNTNQNLTNAARAAGGYFGSIIGSLTGVPQVSQIMGSVVARSAGDRLISTYSTLPLNKLRNPFYLGLSDFRTRLATDSENNSTETNLASAVSNIRLDGASAALRGSKIALGYSIATAIPGGIYTAFNLDAGGMQGYGWGDHGNPHAIRTDFTARSHVATRWQPGFVIPDFFKGGTQNISGMMMPTLRPLERATPFRGDRVTVIDFGKRSKDAAYLWNPGALALGKFIKTNLTQDFIKFFFTGPKITNNSTDPDDVMVFRAIINTLSDSHTGNWTPQNFIGRADPNYTYTGYTRGLDLDFTVFATDRDEMKPIYRKLNALAGYTAPTYLKDSIAMQGPWMRITIGDLFQQTPVILTSVSYTMVDADTTWEINIEDDPEMMQAPHKISVNCSFIVVSDELPQKGGRFYGLAKKYNESNSAIEGNDNWLSDSLGNVKLVQPPAVEDPESAYVNDKTKRHKKLFGKRKTTDALTEIQ